MVREVSHHTGFPSVSTRCQHVVDATEKPARHRDCVLAFTNCYAIVVLLWSETTPNTTK